MRRALPCALLAAGVVACGPSERPELAGDRAYSAGRYRDALEQYREAAGERGGGRVWAKLGAAALRAGELRAAADAYRQLAADDPTRADEAAEGLDAVATEAERRGGAAALQDAVLGLRAVAPERPLGRHALALARGSSLRAADAVALLPAAMAAAPDAETVDSLLAAYGAALQESSGCEQAAPAYRAALRRTRTTEVRARAGGGLATCALSLGLVALGAGHADQAAEWFVQAVRVDSASWVGRRALIGLGDARVGQGDILAAAIAYQSAADAGLGDSLGRIARERLNALGGGGAPADTARRRAP
ncbi:MAG TPA: tetratricopeptide repeat protein [Gemmatimonadales bacterium]|nr:tetratricopeptide repeat protein [Gemmatimonadales bacterium]